MKVLIFGASGSGKTYTSSNLKQLGINAVDADLIDGLSSWYDENGNKVKYPKDADKKFLDNHEFLWDKDFLSVYLNKQQDVYLFGLSGNIFKMIDLFDKAYFLKVDYELLKERLTHESRENPMGKTEYQRQAVIDYAKMLEEKSKELGIEFIDATTLKPEQIFDHVKFFMINKCSSCGTCCSLFLINLSEEEYKSGKYKTQLKEFGLINDFYQATACGANIIQQKKDGSCIYLNANKCSIHKTRPQVCREFFCTSKLKKFRKMVEMIEKEKAVKVV